MSKHSKGPWNYEIEGEGLIYISSKNSIVAELGSITELPTDEDRANAALIASSPDMLETLRAVLNVVQNYNPDRPAAEIRQVTEKMLAAAIARAEGEGVSYE